MKKVDPGLDEWRALYAEAIAFMKLAPWEWMDDTDLFGVQDPEDGEIAWCSVMGGLGQFYALGAYLGSEGLATFLRIASGKASEEEAMYRSKMLMTSFEDRDSVDAEDRKIIKQLGLKMRGRNGWVLFRRHDPGYFPWHIGGDDVRRLTLVLQQAMVVARQAGDFPYHLAPEEKGAHLVRVPGRTADGFVWEDDWMWPDVSAKQSGRKEVVPPPFDEVRARRIKGSVKKGDAVVEMALIPFPMPVREGDERPCYPMVFMALDQESGLALETEMLPMPVFPAALPDLVLTYLEGQPSLPRRIVVEDAELHEWLKPLAKALGIGVKKERKLLRTAELKKELMMHLAPF